MFTQCGKCETVFRLSADALRAAGGQVRCGRCGEVFNALTRLAEEASEFSRGESSYEMESRAEEILETPGADFIGGLTEQDSTPAANDNEPPPGVEIAQLQFLEDLDEDLVAETSLEFTLPPGELDRIFIETRSSPLHELTTDGQTGHRNQAESLMHSVQSFAPAEPPPSPSSPEPPLSALPPPGPPPVAHLHAVPSPRPASGPTEHAREPRAESGPSRKAPSRVPGLEVSETVRLEMLSSYAYAELPTINPQRRRLPALVWPVAAGALTLLLGYQMYRGNAEWLAAHVPFLGGTGGAGSNLAAYQLRQWGVTGDPSAKGRLRVRASILNASAQLQPFPLLRVTLANRFGTRIGSREFQPTEYMGKPISRMLAPGERVDAALDIIDPGKGAEGFEIDVCVRNAVDKVICAADASSSTTAHGP